MIAELISIGDELLNGRTINKNASDISKKLTAIGIQVGWITTVGDHPSHIKDALAIAVTRANVIITTGGLGPTHDDVTREVLCDFFNTELIMNQQVLDAIVSRFKYRGIAMPKINERQALVPKDAEVIYNEVGTAPGLIFRRPEMTMYVLPGVPTEMKFMVENVVLPDLTQRSDRQCIKSKTLRTTGIAESVLVEKLPAIAELEKWVKVAFLPGRDGVDIRLTSAAQTESDCQYKLEQAESVIRSRIEAFIYGVDEISLAETLATKLIQAGQTLAVAESCTGGLLAHKLTNISGSSNFFERGVVCYSNRSKVEMLHVPEKTLVEHGAVSAETALAMAEAVRQLAKTDFGLSTTGIAGPTGGSTDKPVGLVYIGFASQTEKSFERHIFKFDRVENKHRFAQAALNLLRKKLLNIDESRLRI